MTQASPQLVIDLAASIGPGSDHFLARLLGKLRYFGNTRVRYADLLAAGVSEKEVLNQFVKTGPVLLLRNFRDPRDRNTWVVLELTGEGQKYAKTGHLESYIRERLGDSNWPVFVPSLTYRIGGALRSVSVMEGYAFAAAGLADSTYVDLLDDNPCYIKQVLHVRRGNATVLSTLPDTEIQVLRDRLRSMSSATLSLGMLVTVLDGPLQGVEGHIEVLEEDFAVIYIKNRTLETLRTIPRCLLSPVETEEDEQLE